MRISCDANGRFVNYIGEKIDITQAGFPTIKCGSGYFQNSRMIKIKSTKTGSKTTITLKRGLQSVMKLDAKWGEPDYGEPMMFWLLEPDEFLEYTKILEARKVSNQGNFGTDDYWKVVPVWCVVTRYRRKLLSDYTYSNETTLQTEGEYKPTIFKTNRKRCLRPLRRQSHNIDYEDRIGEIFATKDAAAERLEEILSSVASSEEPSQTQPDPDQESQPKTKSEPQLARTGTGFAVHEKYVVTAEHVLNGCKKVRILHSNNDVKAQTVSLDESIDLGLLKLETPMAHSAALRSKPKLRLGDQAINYGYPLFGQLSSSAKITVGYVNALAGYGDDKRIMQFSAPTQPGNSGGPVLDHSGNVIGVVSSSLSKQYAEKMGHIAQNVNFAIKSKTLQRFLKSNRVSFKRVESKKKLELPDIAEKAERFTVLVGCWE